MLVISLQKIPENTENIEENKKRSWNLIFGKNYNLLIFIDFDLLKNYFNI